MAGTVSTSHSIPSGSILRSKNYIAYYSGSKQTNNNEIMRYLSERRHNYAHLFTMTCENRANNHAIIIFLSFFLFLLGCNSFISCHCAYVSCVVDCRGIFILFLKILINVLNIEGAHLCMDFLNLLWPASVCYTRFLPCSSLCDCEWTQNRWAKALKCNLKASNSCNGANSYRALGLVHACNTCTHFTLLQYASDEWNIATLGLHSRSAWRK